MPVSPAFEQPYTFIGRQSRLMHSATTEGFLMEREGLSQRLTQKEQSAARELQAALPDWRDPTA